mgnify:CR=1 FL=1
MHNQTQTTDVRRHQGRVCPPTTSTQRASVDTLVLQVFALILHQHRRHLLSRQNTSVPCSCERAGQRAWTVPTSNPPRLSVLRLYWTILPHMQESGNIPPSPAPNNERHSHPNPRDQDGTSRARMLIILLCTMLRRSYNCLPNIIRQPHCAFSEVLRVGLSPFSPEGNDEGLQ